MSPPMPPPAAPFLPTTPEEVRALGWSELDVLLVTGDAYVDHPSFGAAVIGRALEAQGFRVGVVAQPDWRSTRDVARLGRPRLFVGITSGCMDSMVNHYTAHKRKRSDDAYTPGAAAGRRPDRATTVYARLAREAFGPTMPIVIGGVEASLRRIAHYDYWDDRVLPSVAVTSGADLGPDEILQPIEARLLVGREPMGEPLLVQVPVLLHDAALVGHAFAPLEARRRRTTR